MSGSHHPHIVIPSVVEGSCQHSSAPGSMEQTQIPLCPFGHTHWRLPRPLSGRPGCFYGIASLAPRLFSPRHPGRFCGNDGSGEPALSEVEWIVPALRLGGTAIPACPEPAEWGCAPKTALNVVGLLSRFTRKCAGQRNGGYVACWAVRFPRIVCEVFLNCANGLDSGHSMGHAGHPVPSRDTEQLLMHREAICEAFNPAQTRSITPNAGRVAGRVTAPFTVYAPSTAYA